MKRLILILLLSSLFLHAHAGELDSEDYQKLFGSVRSELVRGICSFSDMTDTTVLNSIDDIDLTKFKTALEGFIDKNSDMDPDSLKKLKLLNKIVRQDIEKLTGATMDKYVNLLEKSINLSNSSLRAKYRESSAELLEFQSDMLRKLAELANACNAYASCTEPIDYQQFIDKETNEYLKAKAAQEMRKPDSGKKEAPKSSPLWILAACAAAVAAIALFLRFRKHKSNNTSSKKGYHAETEAKTIHDEAIRPVPEPKNDQMTFDGTKVRTSFACDNEKISVLGASVIGNAHIQTGTHCQDYCGHEYLDSGWGIAITSDGAGSAMHSEIGSEMVVKRGIHHFKSRIQSKGWPQKACLPTDAEWSQLAYNAMKAIHDDMKLFSEKKNLPLKSIAATAIVLVYTPQGLMVSHVGDGRAGYADRNGQWKSITVPHKGEEANQTIFITSDFWDIPNYVLSGVFVPESRVIREAASAFALMSDGCENNCWICSRLDESTGKYHDQNEPFDKFFNPICNNVRAMSAEHEDYDERKNKWAAFLLSSGKFAKEQDDKTMIVGTLS